MSVSASSTVGSSSTTATCITVTPDSNGYVPVGACNANYNYDPSFIAAIVFTVLFGLALGVHVYQAILYKKIRPCWIIIMGTAWEFASFVLRSVGAKNQQSIALSFVSQILVLLAPLWLNAFDYVVLGRMVHYFLPEQKLWGISARKLAVCFVCADIFSFLTQIGGGSMIRSGNSPDSLLLGIHIYMGGIGLQEFFILTFTAFAFRFRARMIVVQRSEQNRSSDGGSWQSLLYALLGSLVLITIRIIYRLIEFSAGIDANSNPLPFHEWYFYVFDAAPMLLALVLMNIVHPGRILVGPGKEFEEIQNRKEDRGVKREIKEAEIADRLQSRTIGETMEPGQRAGPEEYIEMNYIRR